MKPKINQPENPLFTNGENYSMNACVGDNGGPYGLFEYGRGFFKAGHSIVKSAEVRDAPVDLAVYPAAFTYRHGIELFLKHIVVGLNIVLETGETFKKNHRMIDLWDEVVALSEKLQRRLIEQEAVKRAGVLIGYFDAFDPTGQVFRYPEDIRGNRHLADHKIINVEVLRYHMMELQDILERWVYQIEDHRHWQNDERAYYGEY